MAAVPWYCRYGIHGELQRQTNVDGTAIYRTQEHACDCTPPTSSLLPHHPQYSKQAHGTSMLFPCRPQPSRPAALPTQARRRVRGRVRAVPPLPSRDTSRGSSAPRTRTLLSGNEERTRPLEFYAGGLRVVVPPISGIYTGTSLMAPYASNANGMNADADLPALPSIPVVWPQPLLPPLHDIAAPSCPEVSVPPLSTAAPLTQPDALFPAPPEAQAEAAALPSAAPAPPLTVAGATGSACTAEQHAALARWSVDFCATCGLRVRPLTPDTIVYTAETCPVGPHTNSVPVPNTSAPTARYCVLCGTLLLASAVPPAEIAEGTSAPLPLQTGATSATDVPQQPPSRAETAAAAITADLPDVQTRRDMKTVDEIMAHLLRNAEAHGGHVQGPCGLPHCRLCEASDAPQLSAGPGHSTRDWLTNAASVTKPGRWWETSVMCGSPAVAIIHNHYYT